MGNTINYYLYPEVTPNDKTPLEFNPMAGFPEGARNKKEYKITQAEIESVQVPPEFIDYCLHKNLEWKACQADNFPFLSYCKPHLHRYQACMFEEHKDRQRDYERERRIMVRRQRRLEKQQREQQREVLNQA